jgi:hypothetical protein
LGKDYPKLTGIILLLTWGSDFIGKYKKASGIMPEAFLVLFTYLFKTIPQAGFIYPA